MGSLLRRSNRTGKSAACESPPPPPPTFNPVTPYTVPQSPDTPASPGLPSAVPESEVVSPSIERPPSAPARSHRRRVISATATSNVAKAHGGRLASRVTIATGAAAATPERATLSARRILGATRLLLTWRCRAATPTYDVFLPVSPAEFTEEKSALSP